MLFPILYAPCKNCYKRILRPMQRFDGRRCWLHCICCDMNAPRQRAHTHNPRSNLFGSFIVGHNSYPRISRDGRLYLVSSRGCGNAALVQHTAHGVSGLKEYNCDCVVSPWFSSSALGLLCRLCRLQLILLRYNSLTVNPPFSPLHPRFYPRFEQALGQPSQPCWYLFNTPRVHSPP